MPTCQFIITNADSATFRSGAVQSWKPVTVYKQLAVAGRYRAKVNSITYYDEYNPAPPYKGYVVNLTSSTWTFPGTLSNTQGAGGISFCNNGSYHTQIYPPDSAQYFEINNPSTSMDISIWIQEYTSTGATPFDEYFYYSFTWAFTQFRYLILTLDLEKIPDMV